jgi:F0F1-type ATP synthase membrane subunit c/vacuolar-type H+-ATPase subunit K
MTRCSPPLLFAGLVIGLAPISGERALAQDDTTQAAAEAFARGSALFKKHDFSAAVEAFEEAYRRRPDIKLHQDYDGTHPTELGVYLAASTVYATIYGRSPVGNTYDYYGRISREDAAFLQAVADDTVRKFFGR